MQAAKSLARSPTRHLRLMVSMSTTPKTLDSADAAITGGGGKQPQQQRMRGAAVMVLLAPVLAPAAGGGRCGRSGSPTPSPSRARAGPNPSTTSSSRRCSCESPSSPIPSFSRSSGSSWVAWFPRLLCRPRVLSCSYPDLARLILDRSFLQIA